MKSRQIRVISGEDITLESPEFDAERTPLLVYGPNRQHGSGWTLWYIEKDTRTAGVANYFIPGDRNDIELAEKWARSWLAIHFGDWSWRSARVLRERPGPRSLQVDEVRSPDHQPSDGDGHPTYEPGNGGGPAKRPANRDKVVENRLRRMAARGGYRLMKSRRRDPQASDYGGYTIVDDSTKAVVAGDLSDGGMDLDEVENWLRSNTQRH